MARRGDLAIQIAAGAASFALRSEYAIVKAQVAKRILEEKKTQHAKLMKDGVRLHASDPRKYWIWLRSVSKCRANRGPPIISPMRDSNNNMCTTPVAICEVWTAHLY